MTVIVNAQVLVNPLSSVVLQVLVVTPAGKLEPLAKPLSKIVETIAQLSAAVGLEYITTALHTPLVIVPVALILAGQVIVGATLSVTVTVKEQVLVLPAPSVAFHTTMLLPLGKLEPLARPLIRVTAGAGLEQLSVAVGVV